MANRESYKVPINKQHFFRCLKRHGFTEAKIAEAIGISSKTIQRAVTTGKINPHYLDQMASIMHEDPNYISGIGEVKQESCKDAVSRQAVFDQMYEWMNTCEYRKVNATDYFVNRIKKLPPANPQPKKGHWIRQNNTKEPLYGWYFCSECNSVIGDKTKFCSNCGAKMEELQESEGIE